MMWSMIRSCLFLPYAVKHSSPKHPKNIQIFCQGMYELDLEIYYLLMDLSSRFFSHSPLEEIFRFFFSPENLEEPQPPS